MLSRKKNLLLGIFISVALFVSVVAPVLAGDGAIGGG